MVVKHIFLALILVLTSIFRHFLAIIKAVIASVLNEGLTHTEEAKWNPPFLHFLEEYGEQQLLHNFFCPPTDRFHIWSGLLH